MMITIGAAHIACPECADVIPVPVSGELTTDDDGRQYLHTEPDMADLWAHMWTHDGGAA